MFQPAFSVFLFTYHTLNCHSHSANTKPRNMFMFFLFIKRIATLLASYSALAQLYADDVQAYLHCSPSDTIATTRVMSSIMRALETWMSSNRLRLNSAKTQFIWLGTRQQLS